MKTLFLSIAQFSIKAECVPCLPSPSACKLEGNVTVGFPWVFCAACFLLHLPNLQNNKTIVKVEKKSESWSWIPRAFQSGWEAKLIQSKESSYKTVWDNLLLQML